MKIMNAITEFKATILTDLMFVETIRLKLLTIARIAPKIIGGNHTQDFLLEVSDSIWIPKKTRPNLTNHAICLQ
jgi:hypothetical protein